MAAVFRSLFDVDWERPLYLYGSGRLGEAVLTYCRAAGRPVAGFIDSRTSGWIFGLPLVPIAEYRLAYRPEHAVVVTSQNHPTIGRMLDELGIEHHVGYFLGLLVLSEMKRHDSVLALGELPLSRDGGR